MEREELAAALEKLGFLFFFFFFKKMSRELLIDQAPLEPAAACKGWVGQQIEQGRPLLWSLPFRTFQPVLIETHARDRCHAGVMVTAARLCLLVNT